MKEAALPPNLPPPRTFPTAARLFHADANDGALPAGSSRGTPLWGERQKSNGYCHEKEICQTEIPDRRLRHASGDFSTIVFCIFRLPQSFKTPKNNFRLPAPEAQTPAIAERMAKARKRVQRYSATEPRPSAIIKKPSTPKEEFPGAGPPFFTYRYRKYNMLRGACTGERSRGGGLEGAPLLKRRPLQGLPLQ